jgi:OmpA-OmpF porin, OOP family
MCLAHKANIVVEQNMKIARAFRLTAALAALALTQSPTAFADDAGWYAGFNAGQSRAKIDDARIANGLLLDGFTTTSIGDDNHHFGFKAFGGYEFNRYFALESGYFDLGRFGFTADTLPAGSLRGDIKIKGVNFDAVGSVPIGEKFSLFARAGVNYADSKDSFSGTGAVAVINPSPHKWAANYKFGFGAEYDFNRFVGMRLEGERYRVDDAVGNKGDVDLYSAGLVFKFGRAEPAPIPRAVAPEPVVQAAPPPPPPPPPPPAPPIRKRISFSADSLFDFAKDTVKPAGKQALDVFAAELKGAQFDVITVTGYTDRIGSHDYNMKLSTRRAESVKSYLVETAGIPSDKITARGADGSDPVTKPDECPGEKRTPKLIACLQPDRRVDVEVVGSRLQAAPNNN